MVDSYRWGKVDRISPEAPVPIISIDKKEDRLGGAANVALNLKSLGANPILCGVIGNDENGNKLNSLLSIEGLSNVGVVRSDERKTTMKTRIISDGQHMLRMDEEDLHQLSSIENDLVLNSVINILKKKKIDVIIFEDYDKGLLNQELIQAIVSKANDLSIPTAVDPKKLNFDHYSNVTLFKPNRKELLEGLKIDDVFEKSDYIKICQNYITQKNIDMMLLTLSEDGVLITSKEHNHIDPAYRRDISDVSGAGDTVISVASLALACNLDIVLISSLANLAGGLVCEKVGVVAIDKNTLHNEAIRLLID